MARTKAEVGLRKSREDRRSRPPNGERPNRMARAARAPPPTPRPEDANPLEELPAPVGMAPETGNGRGSTSWAPRAMVVAT